MPPFKLPYPTPDYVYPGKEVGEKPPFSQWTRKPPPTFGELRSEGKPNSARQLWFEDQARRIAEHIGEDRVPWAFEFSDGKVFQLDRGCVRMAVRRHVFREPPSDQRIEYLVLRAKAPADSSSPPPVPQGKEGETLAAQVAQGVRDEHILAAAAFIDENSAEQVKSFAGTNRWATTHFVLVNGRRYPAKIFGLIAKRLATGEILDPQRINSLTFLDGLASLGVQRAEDDGSILDAVCEAAERDGAFDPSDTTDARTRALRAIVQRQGQRTFRKALLAAYSERCAVTGCDLVETLEAAHISPHLGKHTDHVANGLLLRADIHTLFDQNLIAFDPDKGGVLMVSAVIAGTKFADRLKKLRLRSPKNPAHAPNAEALRDRLRNLR